MALTEGSDNTTVLSERFRTVPPRLLLFPLNADVTDGSQRNILSENVNMVVESDNKDPCSRIENVKCCDYKMQT